MTDDGRLKKIIIKSAYITIIFLIVIVIALLILKYQVEGEKNMPFKLSSVIIISNAEGYQEKENPDYRWDAQVFQNNDIYLNIEKNKNYKETEIIKSVVLENIKIDKKPQVGNIEFYRPSEDDKKIFNYNEEYLINEKIEYYGDIKSDLKNLKISNQGSTIILRAINRTNKNYTSNENELEHNGRLLNKVGISYEQIMTQVSFDLIINLESGISFRSTLDFQLPVGDIIKEGSSSIEIKDTRKFVFKREQS